MRREESDGFGWLLLMLALALLLAIALDTVVGDVAAAAAVRLVADRGAPVPAAGERSFLWLLPLVAVVAAALPGVLTAAPVLPMP